MSVIDGGRIINQRAARNQIEGSIMMGIGMALFEETHCESQTGHPINNNLADYCMVVNADTPEIDVTFLDYLDLVLNEYGARGVGEIGLVGVAAASASAVYHSSGVSIRRLPVKIENLLEPEGRTITNCPVSTSDGFPAVKDGRRGPATASVVSSLSVC